MDHLSVGSCDCHVAFSDKIPPLTTPLNSLSLIFGADWSYGNQNRFEMILWYLESIVLKSHDVTVDGFPNILYRFFTCLSLADTAWKAGAFSHPVSIFSRVNDNLSHSQFSLLM
jgi:hypothetical protein